MIHYVSTITAYMIIVSVVLVCCLLISAIYILTKRVLTQFWVAFTMAGYIKYLRSKYMKEIKTKDLNWC